MFPYENIHPVCPTNREGWLGPQEPRTVGGAKERRGGQKLRSDSRVPRHENSNQQDHAHNDPAINEPASHVLTKRCLAARGPKPIRERNPLKSDEVVMPYDEQ